MKRTYTVAELAALKGISEDEVLRHLAMIFADKPWYRHWWFRFRICLAWLRRNFT